MKVFVDTAPVMEKPLAAAAGLGWQGKHTNLVSREFGSWLFLGAIFTDAELPPDAPETTIAARAGLPRHLPDRRLSRRPISSMRGAASPISPSSTRGRSRASSAPPIGNRIYGCDDCLAVCPWNKFASAAREAKLAARDDWRAPPLAELARLDDAAFRGSFSGSPVKRIGRERFIRNVLIAIGNSGDAGAGRAKPKRLFDDRRPAGSRRGGLGARAPGPDARRRACARQRLANETDTEVRDEWMGVPQAAGEVS